EDVENIIHELLTSEEAISRLIETLFANFQLDVQRLDSEIFDLLDDGDDTFSNSGGSETDTTETTQYFLDFGKGQAAKIANSEQQALEFTLDFLEERHLASFPGAVWNEAAQIGVQVSNKFQSGKLLLDPLLIEKIITEKFSSSDPVLDAELKKELSNIKTQKGFLAKFATMREFIDFAAVHHTTANDAATFTKLFQADLIARTPKYYEDQRSLLDVLKGKATDFDTSTTGKVFQGTGDKITTAAKGVAQVLGSGYGKLATSNFEDFVRDNPLLLMEHLLSQKAATTDTDELARLNNEINSLQEFQTRHLDNLTSWLQAKNKQLAKTKAVITRLETEAANPNTEPQRITEIQAKITSLINSSKTKDAGLQVETLKSRANFSLSQLEALRLKEVNEETPNQKKLAAIDKDIELIQNTLLIADADIVEQAIRNGAAIVINKTVASDLKSIKDQTKLIKPGSNSIAESQAIITGIKTAYNNHEFLRLADISGVDIDNEALTEIINTVVRTKNAHAALYASETLESGKINAQFTTKKLATPGEDGSVPVDNQIAPPQISPTASAAAIGAIGNQILLKINNIINEKTLPDETWIHDNAKIIKDINDQITPTLESAGEVFFNQLRRIFRTTISSFFNEHNSSKDSLDDAKTTSSFEKNLSKDSNLGNDASEILQDVETAINRLGTSNPETASDKIFVNKDLEKSIKSIKKFVDSNLDYESQNFKNQINLDAFKDQIAAINLPANGSAEIQTSIDSLQGFIDDGSDETTWNSHIATLAADLGRLANDAKEDKHNSYLRTTNLAEIQTRLQAIADGSDSSLDDLQEQASLANAQFDNRNTQLTNYRTEIANLERSTPIDNTRINELNGLIDSLNADINSARNQRDNAQSQITAIKDRAQALLDGDETNNKIGIDELLTHLNDKKVDVIQAMNAYQPAIPEGVLKDRLKKYEKELSKEYSSNLINTDSIDNIQDQLNEALFSTSFDLNGDGDNDFDSIQLVIDKIDGLADNVTNIFGSSYDKAQKLNQLENSLITKQVLQAELAQTLQAELDAGTSPARAEEISKMLYGFEEIAGVMTTGSATNLMDNALLADIEDLGDINEDIKIDNTTILRKVLDPQFINGGAGQAKIDAISKILYGFETTKLDNGEIETTIGTADSMKDKSLIDGIKDLRTEASRILDMEIPEDETDLVNLLDERKADFGGIEQQSIKRLILLMFVLSMLEYSDWDYRKTEADQSRYSVT
ncbi:MAG: hypothetical protein HOA17_00975, partial [Candidatus Melainabacteria bacterium]|nr:hypothetical protein [Candidatus Melainabacteria bacterium]